LRLQYGDRIRMEIPEMKPGFSTALRVSSLPAEDL